MINNRLVIVVIVTALCTGCSEEYSHRRLGTDGPEATQVRSMVSALRKAGADGLVKMTDRQALPGLTEDQLKGLRSMLEKIVTADSVELQKIERFGEQVYRIVLALESEGGPESLAMLLGPAPDDTLKWIGKN